MFWCRENQVVFIVITFRNAASCCCVIGWLATCVNKWLNISPRKWLFRISRLMHIFGIFKVCYYSSYYYNSLSKYCHWYVYMFTVPWAKTSSRACLSCFFSPLFASCVSLPVPLVTHRSAEERRLGNRALGEGMHSQRAANGESLSGGWASSLLDGRPPFCIFLFTSPVSAVVSWRKDLTHNQRRAVRRLWPLQVCSR